MDAGPADAGTPDLGARDAGQTSDAEPADAAVADAAVPDATVTDGAVVDAAPEDSGADAGLIDDAAIGDAPAPDASPPDTGVEDAAALDSGATPDAGLVDVGPRDAGGFCTSNLDCNSGAEVCGRVRVINNVVRTLCGAPNPSPPARAIGSPCVSDMGCASNMCLSGISDECSVACADTGRDCPADFACVSYRFNPGPVWVGACSRACADDATCEGAHPGTVCTTHDYPTSAGWQLDTVCNAPLGAGHLGEACADGGDCRSGLCLTTSRLSCTSSAACGAGESCRCSNGSAPPCPGGAGAACVSSGCTSPCDDPTDCASSPFVGNALTQCSRTLRFVLPDMSEVDVLACTRP